MRPETTAPINREERTARLAKRRARMPIIDRARARGHGAGDAQRRAPWSWLWLRFLRPIAVALFWLLVLRYAWTHLFGSTDDLPWWQQAALYVVVIGVILLVMLMLAPMRRREVRSEPSGNTETSTLDDLSEFSNFGPLELEELQRTQMMVVHHDEDGMPDRAAPAPSTEPGQLR